MFRIFHRYRTWIFSDTTFCCHRIFFPTSTWIGPSRRSKWCGVGMFIAGPLVQTLLNLYGLQGTFLVLAAISANHVVIGALMSPSDLEYKHKKDLKMKQHMKMVSSKRNNNIGYTLKNLLHFHILLNKAFMFCNPQYSLFFLTVTLNKLCCCTRILQGRRCSINSLRWYWFHIWRIVSWLSNGHNGWNDVVHWWNMVSYRTPLSGLCL